MFNKFIYNVKYRVFHTEKTEHVKRNTWPSLRSKRSRVVLVNRVRLEEKKPKRSKRKESEGNACRQTPWF